MLPPSSLTVPDVQGPDRPSLYLRTVDFVDPLIGVDSGRTFQTHGRRGAGRAGPRSRCPDTNRDARAGGVATFRFAVRPPRCPLPLRGASSPHAAEQVRTWDDSRQASGFRARSGPHFGRHARCAPQAHGNLGIRRPCLGRNRRDLCLRSGRRDRSDQNAAEYDIFEGRVSCRRPTIPIPKSNFRG